MQYILSEEEYKNLVPRDEFEAILAALKIVRRELVSKCCQKTKGAIAVTVMIVSWLMSLKKSC